MLDKLDKMKINKESSNSDIQECIDLGLGSIGNQDSIKYIIIKYLSRI
jgi:hypothetical protein